MCLLPSLASCRTSAPPQRLVGNPRWHYGRCASLLSLVPGRPVRALRLCSFRCGFHCGRVRVRFLCSVFRFVSVPLLCPVYVRSLCAQWGSFCCSRNALTFFLSLMCPTGPVGISDSTFLFLYVILKPLAYYSMWF